MLARKAKQTTFYKPICKEEEHMARYFKALVFMVAVVFIAGNAWSQVEYAPEGKGDVLIYPFYAAFDGGWQTKLTVVNTDNNKSSIAKVVVRSPKYTGELVDFLVYLSPSDVWTGYLKYDPEEGPVLYSEDDSIVSGFDREGYENRSSDETMSDFVTYGDEEAAERALYTSNSQKNLVDGDYAEMGYVYVINVTSGDMGSRPVDKDEIIDAYLPFDNNYGDPVETPENALAGWTDFEVGGYGVASLNAVTLKNYENLTKIVPQRESELAPEDMDESGGSTDTTLQDIELALAKQDIAMPYQSTDDAFSAHIFTFPTKYTLIGEYEDIGSSGLDNMGSRSEWDGFYSTGDYSDEYKAEVVEYSGSIYNLQEDTPAGDDPIWSPSPAPESYLFPYEQNLNFSSDFEYDEGWAKYTIGDYGAPVIPVSLDFTMDGMSFKHGAWTEGTALEYDGDEVPVP